MLKKYRIKVGMFIVNPTQKVIFCSSIFLFQTNHV